MPVEKVGVIVLGAGGFVGGELLRILATHPRFVLQAALSGTHAGKAVGDVYPGLRPWTNLRLMDARDWPWERMEEGPWVLFSALGHRETMTLLPSLLEKILREGIKVVDLSGDFRLKNPDLYPVYYGYEHAAPAHLKRFVYGLPEGSRKRITGADLVANPGCFATGAQLAILPLASRAPGVKFVALDSKTGSSGAGIRPSGTTHHPNRMNNFRAYKILKHQHTPEILAGWLDAGGSPETQISFAPHMAPMVRGIFTTAHVFCDAETSSEEVRSWYESFYEDAPFVRLVEDSPSVTDVWGTNRCDISIKAEGCRIVVCTAIDNLVKGAAGQAVQNANLMSGFEETTGLLMPPPTPV